MSRDLKHLYWALCLIICQSRYTFGDRSAVEPIACSQIVSSMGPFYRWPTPNPGMVAPVAAVYNYPVYRNPLKCYFTGTSIQVEIPNSYGAGAGFHLGTTGVPGKNDEKYRLSRIEIRKPPQQYSGLGQALTHVMEMVLIHRQMGTSGNTSRWANVILPFQVSTNGNDIDILNPMVSGTVLPSRIGESGTIMASAVSQMMLSPAYEKANFQEFWGTAPAAGCTSKTVNNRYFMRSTTLAIGVDTFAQLSQALENAAVQEPVQPPQTTWLVGTCHNNSGSCVLPKAENLQAKVSALQKATTQATTEQKSRKKDLDLKLAKLKNHTGPATKESIQTYDAAVAAYDDLRAAASELVSAEAQLSTAQTQFNEAQSSKWDQNLPKAVLLAQSSTGTTKPAAATLVEIGNEQEQYTCNSLGQSPVDIETKRVVDPYTLSPALLEPLSFRYTSLVDMGHQPNQGVRLQVSNRGRHLRVAVPPRSVEWPLGGVLSGGVLRGVSYIDIHVPGQHTVDGHAPAAELQLVHESAGGKPAMALSVPLELRDSPDAAGGGANEWLTPLLASIPQKDAVKEISGQPLSFLHSAFSSGQTGKYYRYDGSLTKPPCLLAEWFILEEPGYLSQQQLSLLAAALGTDPDAKTRSPTFMSALVMRGSPHLVNQVVGRHESLGSVLSHGSRLRLRRRLAV